MGHNIKEIESILWTGSSRIWILRLFSIWDNRRSFAHTNIDLDAVWMLSRRSMAVPRLSKTIPNDPTPHNSWTKLFSHTFPGFAIGSWRFQFGCMCLPVWRNAPRDQEQNGFCKGVWKLLRWVEATISSSIGFQGIAKKSNRKPIVVWHGTFLFIFDRFYMVCLWGWCLQDAQKYRRDRFRQRSCQHIVLNFLTVQTRGGLMQRWESELAGARLPVTWKKNSIV